MQSLIKRTCFLFLLLPALILSCRKDHIIHDIPSDNKKKFILAGERGVDISYYDINPDWNRYAYGLAPDSLNIDINNDHITDVSIRYASTIGASNYIVQTTVSCYHGASFSLAPKNRNDTINENSSWSTSNSILGFTKIDFTTADTTSSGAWISTTDKYLGVKVFKNGRTSYGWIRMSLFVNPATIYIQQVMVKDFAFRKNL